MTTDLDNTMSGLLARLTWLASPASEMNWRRRVGTLQNWLSSGTFTT